ncbi:unnamed protein product [Rotaria magnacalcarata]|uniref:SS18 N-terminal domain-containing protein n=2 Tax=Rotaria magnacalcarata TaxID=392030 RepID=A0A816SU09_9BILA|nr:unnamed protein product [Rotaria magnacalcarata]CAF1553450.1 unnamed protein product [Rotaria magnacalcarata]CAF1973732.1 unnamed protein product [Rotaria magnacalcarata]CAF2092331.1 unnamed protein product [Rotaria magnacalcarata]CAF2117081.1 unnamed protein product [Rotaria magnacalcarata]
MSKIFLTDPETGNNYPGDEQTVANLLRENAALIRTIKELQNEGNNDNLFDYMKQLHRNILWLSLLADETSTKNQ